MNDNTTRKLPSMARINFWVDLLIAVAFAAVAVSGVVLFAAGTGGRYRGGRNPAVVREVLFLGRTAWKDLHDWSGIAMMAGVLGHLVLHANWIACQTRQLFRKNASRGKAAEACPAEA
jgi:hypothetical protein